MFIFLSIYSIFADVSFKRFSQRFFNSLRFSALTLYKPLIWFHHKLGVHINLCAQNPVLLKPP